MLIRKKAFSLTELLIALAVLAILFSLLIPSLNSTLDKARTLQCQNHLRQLGNAFMFYAEDHIGTVPRIPGYPYLRTNLYSTGYLKNHLDVYHEYSHSPHDNKILGCPSEKDQGTADSSTNSGYRGSHYGVSLYLKNFYRPNFWFNDKPWLGQCHPEKTAMIGDAIASPGPHSLNLRKGRWSALNQGAFAWANLIAAPDIFRHVDAKVSLWYTDGHVERVDNWDSEAMAP